MNKKKLAAIRTKYPDYVQGIRISSKIIQILRQKQCSTVQSAIEKEMQLLCERMIKILKFYKNIST